LEFFLNQIRHNCNCGRKHFNTIGCWRVNLSLTVAAVGRIRHSHLKSHLSSGLKSPTHNMTCLTDMTLSYLFSQKNGWIRRKLFTTSESEQILICVFSCFECFAILKKNAVASLFFVFNVFRYPLPLFSEFELGSPIEKTKNCWILLNCRILYRRNWLWPIVSSRSVLLDGSFEMLI
jgi:hypothetical protein